MLMKFRRLRKFEEKEMFYLKFLDLRTGTLLFNKQEKENKKLISFSFKNELLVTFLFLFSSNSSISKIYFYYKHIKTQE